MPFADLFSPTAIEAVQAVLLAVVAAYVAIRTRQLDAVARAADQRASAHRDYCEGLEKRVAKLEQRARRRRRAKRTPKRPPPRKRK